MDRSGGHGTLQPRVAASSSWACRGQVQLLVQRGAERAPRRAGAAAATAAGRGSRGSARGRGRRSPAGRRRRRCPAGSAPSAACAARSAAASRTSSTPVPYGRNRPLCGSSTIESARSMPASRRPAALGELEEPAVGRVDVEPQARRRGPARPARQRVDGAGVGGAGACRPAGTAGARRPGRRRSCVGRGAGSMRRSAAVGTTRTLVARRPAIRAALATQWWVCSVTYSVPSREVVAEPVVRGRRPPPTAWPSTRRW